VIDQCTRENREVCQTGGTREVNKSWQ
jgi:hypothetical protein